MMNYIEAKQDIVSHPVLIKACIAVTFAALLLPVWIVQFPPLADYPNHIVRLWLLSGGAETPPLPEWYRVNWDTFTNIGIDLVGGTLARWVGFVRSGQVLLTLAVMLPPVGGALLWYSVHRRLGFELILFSCLAWGGALLTGFLNFQISCGLALLFGACDGRITKWHPAMQFAVRALLSSVLIGTHPFGFVLYAIVLTGLFINRTSVKGVLAPSNIARFLLLVLSLALPFTLLVVLAPKLPGTQVGAGIGSILQNFRNGYWELRLHPAHKLNRGLISLQSYSNAIDLLTAAAIVVPFLTVAFRTRIRIHLGLALSAAVLGVLFVIVPFEVAGTYFIDARFSAFAPFVVLAALGAGVTGRVSRAVVVAVTCVSLLRTGAIAYIWDARQADVAALRMVLNNAEPGKRILPLENRPAPDAPVPLGRYNLLGQGSFRHLPTLAIPWRHDFVPTLFASRGKQPIEVVKAMQDFADPEGGELASIAALSDPAVFQTALQQARYLAKWQEFDYALLVNADVPDRNGSAIPPDLQLIADAGFARLYRIDRRRTPPAPSN